MAAYIKAHEPAELYSQAAQDRLFEAYHVPKAMSDYLKHGNLRLEFPEEKSVGWVKLFSYLDVPEVSCQGKKGLALMEDSEDFEVMLIWEPGSRKIWFQDIEHDVFQPVCTWSKFISSLSLRLSAVCSGAKPVGNIVLYDDEHFHPFHMAAMHSKNGRPRY